MYYIVLTNIKCIVDFDYISFLLLFCFISITAALLMTLKVTVNLNICLYDLVMDELSLFGPCVIKADVGLFPEPKQSRVCRVISLWYFTYGDYGRFRATQNIQSYRKLN